MSVVKSDFRVSQIKFIFIPFKVYGNMKTPIIWHLANDYLAEGWGSLTDRPSCQCGWCIKAGAFSLDVPYLSPGKPYVYLLCSENEIECGQSTN